MPGFEIQIENLPADATERDVLDHVRSFRGARLCEIVGTTAYVTLADQNAVDSAVRQLNGKKLRGGGQLVVRSSSGGKGKGSSPQIPTKVNQGQHKADMQSGPGSVTGKDHRRAAPYHFVPVEPNFGLTAKPVFHNWMDLTRQWTGELRCELTALTPLLAANDQYDFDHSRDGTPVVASPEVQGAYQTLLEARLGTGGGKPVTVDPKKKLLEPLIMSGAHSGEAPGPVLVAGTALKGMLRQSLQALLSAPLERVAERTFSFRPNLKDSRNMAPAIVLQCEKDNGRLTSMEVEFAGTCDEMIYVQERAEDPLERWLEQRALPGEGRGLENLPLRAPRARIDASVPGARIDARRQYAKKLTAGSPSDSAPLADYVLARYRGGLDGTTTFARAFAKEAKGHRWALLRARGTPQRETIPTDVLANYSDTLEHLGDAKNGHLRSHPCSKHLADAPDSIRRFRVSYPQIGDVVYVESIDGKIVGLGHHFRHRRRYRDTIRKTEETTFQADHLAGELSKLRDILAPRPLELRTEDGRPVQLTAARLLFGYVGAREYHDNEPLTFGIGVAKDGGELKATDFTQLAGRIGFNAAVEQATDRGLGQRFLNAKHDCLVPLRPLGSPKASAVEHYLEQDPERLRLRSDGGILCTYGDTMDDPGAGDLRGRKFYLHQPNAASDRLYYELFANNQQVHDEDREMITSDQAAIGRFVSCPDTKFHFSLRFVNLRDWELGALIFALSPMLCDVQTLLDGFGGALGEPLRGALENWLTASRAIELRPKQPALAHKLGHGRPLGLGSVEITVCELHRLTCAEERLVDLKPLEVNATRMTLIAALATKLTEDLGINLPRWVETCFLPWLRVHRYAGRDVLDYPYPRLPDRDGTIYDYHTDLHAKHAAGRKHPAPAVHDRYGLKDLKELD